MSTKLNKHTVIAACLIAILLSACSSDGTDSVDNELETTNGQSESNGASETDVIGQTFNTSIGTVFVAGDAMRSLYTFANDTDGVSNCSGGCLDNWPAVTAETALTIGQFSTIERDDGSLQWVFKNRPVYYYQGDAGAGDVTGEGLGGVWFVARPDPISTGLTSLGTVLVAQGSIRTGSESAAQRTDVDGMTLYTFQNDSLNASACNDQCAVAWPPLYADSGALPGQGFTIVTRDDGTAQWAQNGQALYLYQGDSAPGDTNGDGVGGVWDVALPAN